MLVSTKLLQMYEIDNGQGIFPMSDKFFSLDYYTVCTLFYCILGILPIRTYY